MKQFALTEATEARLVNVNPRREKHGQTKVPAVDLRLEITAPNTILDQLKGPELRAALYTSAAEAGEAVLPIGAAMIGDDGGAIRH